MKKYWFIPLIVLPLMLAGCQSTGELGGTNWSVKEVLATKDTNLAAMDIEFSKDGIVKTTTTRADGTKEVSRHKYKVNGALIVEERAEGNLNVLHRIDGDEMILTAETFQARLKRQNY